MNEAGEMKTVNRKTPFTPGSLGFVMLCLMITGLYLLGFPLRTNRQLLPIMHKQGNEFIFTPKQLMKFPVAKIRFLFDFPVDRLSIVEYPHESRIGLHSTNGRMIRFDCKKELVFQRIEVFARGGFTLRGYYQCLLVFIPPGDPASIFWQASTLFCLVGFWGALIYLSVSLVFFPDRGIKAALDWLRFSFLLWLLLRLVFFFIHYSEYSELFKEIPFWKHGSIMIPLCLAQIALFSLLRKRPFSSSWILPVFYSLLIVLIPVKFIYSFCGDAKMWKIFLDVGSRSSGCAETFSFLLNRVISDWFRNLGWVNPSLTAFTVSAKLIGILYALALFFLIREMDDLTERQKILLYLVSMLLPVAVFFGGYPEFAFYNIPFLFFSLLFSYFCLY